MVLTCDAPRCNDRALVWWLNDAGRSLTYCGHCSDGLADAMVRADWVQVDDEREPVEAYSS